MKFETAMENTGKFLGGIAAWSILNYALIPYHLFGTVNEEGGLEKADKALMSGKVASGGGKSHGGGGGHGGGHH